MEETRSVKIVGSYSIGQVDIKDCRRCHDAKYGTVIINGLCIDCHDKKVLEKEIIDKFTALCIPSLSPESYAKLEDVLDELNKNRHIECITDRNLFVDKVWKK